MLAFESLSFWEKRSYTEGIDFLVIGAGISGLSTAIELKTRHKTAKVLVVERSYLPLGASTKNAGFACIGSPSELLDDLKQSKEEIVFATVEKRYRGLQRLRERLGDKAIRYQSLGAYEIFDKKEKALYKKCLDQLDYLNQKLSLICGIKQTFKPLNDYCHKAHFEGFEYAISHAAEAQIEPDHMMEALYSKAQEVGVKMLYGLAVEHIDQSYAETPYGRLQFEKAAICVNGLAAQFLDEDVRPARAQVLVTSPLSNLKWQGIHHFEEGYYYFRNIGNRVLLGGGRNIDFKAEETTCLETTKIIQAQLEKILREQLLKDQDFKIDYRWAGLMGVGQKKAPIVKAINQNLYCGVRLGGMGVAIGSMLGEELAILMSD